MLHTITIIEDDQSFSNLLKSLIDTDKILKVAHQFFNTIDALTLPNHPTDIAIVDIQLPDGSGVDLVQKLQPQLPDTKFIMCTSFDDDDKIFNSLKAGACGYIVKTDDPENIVAHIHDAINGGAPMSAGIALRVVKYFQQLNKPAQLDELSAKENTILQDLSKGFLYKEIAVKYNLSIDTIKKHCGNIYRKLQVSNRTEAINKLR